MRLGVGWALSSGCGVEGGVCRGRTGFGVAAVAAVGKMDSVTVVAVVAVVDKEKAIGGGGHVEMGLCGAWVGCEWVVFKVWMKGS